MHAQRNGLIRSDAFLGDTVGVDGFLHEEGVEDEAGGAVELEGGVVAMGDGGSVGVEEVGGVVWVVTEEGEPVGVDQ